MNNDYDFIKDKYPTVYRYICDAINTKVIDPETSLFKTRKSLEFILKNVMKKINYNKKLALNDMIEILFKKRKYAEKYI